MRNIDRVKGYLRKCRHPKTINEIHAATGVPKSSLRRMFSQGAEGYGFQSGAHYFEPTIGDTVWTGIYRTSHLPGAGYSVSRGAS